MTENRSEEERKQRHDEHDEEFADAQNLDLDNLTVQSTPGEKMDLQTNDIGLPGNEIGSEPPDLDPVDRYTGQVDVVIPGNWELDPITIESFADETEDLPFLEEDTAMNFAMIDANVNGDAVMDVIDDYTKDPDILEDFAERQGYATGSPEFLDKLEEHHSQGPRLAGGDVDAAWDRTNVSGEEDPGGTVPTPDQDIVDDIGGAVGITYDDDEPLATADRLGERDEKRWELDPKSVEDSDSLLDSGDLTKEDEDLDDF